MNEPNYTTMTYGELVKCADYAADWLDERGLTVSNVVDLRKARQDRGLLMGIVWAWREAVDQNVEALNRATGQGGDIGEEM